jgi:uncharacterized membrane protein YedE/YeeE
MTIVFYQVVFVDTWSWWAGGIVIGLLVPLMYWLFNTALGVSTGYGNFVKLLTGNSKLKWLNSSTFADRWGWRVFFIAGMIGGGFVSARLAGAPLFTAEMDTFSRMVSWPVLLQGLFFFVGGLMLAYGARTAGGCTSGHSIHGIANLHLSSIIATIFFVLFGVLSTWLVRTLLFGGGA